MFGDSTGCLIQAFLRNEKSVIPQYSVSDEMTVFKGVVNLKSVINS